MVIDEIKNDHRAILRAYREQPTFKASVQKCIDALTDFAAGWAPVAPGSQRFKRSVAD